MAARFEPRIYARVSGLSLADQKVLAQLDSQILRVEEHQLGTDKIEWEWLMGIVEPMTREDIMEWGFSAEFADLYLGAIKEGCDHLQVLSYMQEEH